MTKREWKIGDVALRTGGYTAKQMLSLVVSGEGCASGHSQKPHWHHADGGWDHLSGVSTYRPLVVIDPEDREAVEDEDITEMQRALREFAKPTPPKPEEPTGLGAVVEDADGNRWVRAGQKVSERFPWIRWRGATGNWEKYADIDAVKILSDGVSDGS